jgi:radical SAM superfamily enzyme YgiQ (UPF0313 family)
MRILFVWPDPPGFNFEYYPNKNRIPRLIEKLSPLVKPLNFAVLAEVTPEEHKVEIVEGLPEKIKIEGDYDIVAITSTTRYVHWTYEVADWYKQKGFFVVIGGWHASMLPEEAKQHADCVIVGEAEETWPLFLKDFKQGKTKSFYYPEHPVDPSLIPHPSDKLYPWGTKFAVLATRGCPTGCNFCSITNMKFRNIFRKRPVEEVIKDIKARPSRVFNFEDNSLTNDPVYSKELFKAMKDINKKFFAFANINVLERDEEFLRLARDAGCVGFSVGFESIYQENIDFVTKPTNKVEKYVSGIKKVHDHGIIMIGSFVFGGDYDNLDVFEKTDDFVNRYDVDVPDPYVLTPYPGTPLFRMLESQGRILTRDWSRYNLERVVFKPRNMTPEELEFNTKLLHDKWYKYHNIIRRTIKSARFGPGAFSISLSQNYLSRLLARFNYD